MTIHKNKTHDKRPNPMESTRNKQLGDRNGRICLKRQSVPMAKVSSETATFPGIHFE